jgi:CRP-like cAMP-binding protein
MLFMNVNEALQVLKTSRVFHDFEESMLDTLMFLSYTKTFDEGDTIYIKGEPSNDRFGMILSGKVNIITGEGKVFTTVGSGDVIGEIALSDPNRKRTMTVEAFTDTEILEWDVNHVKKEVPGLWKRLVKLAWEHMREYYEDIE